MHEYYKKKRDKLKKTMKGFLALVSTELESTASKAYSEVFEEIWGIYERDMLSRFPYIGGDGASSTKKPDGSLYARCHGRVPERVRSVGSGGNNGVLSGFIRRTARCRKQCRK